MNAKLRMRLTAAALAGCLWTLGVGASHAQLRVTSHTGSIDGLLANSHLIAGKDEGLLIDAQLTRSDAQKVVEMIELAHIDRLKVFITHGHPDHYLGLAEIVAAFPRARIFSNAATAIAIARNGDDARTFWRQSLGDDIADRVVVPEVLRGPKFDLEGETIRVIDFNNTETAISSALYLRERGWLFSGDMVFSGIHLRLDENRPKKWRLGLEKLTKIGTINIVYPGHGESGSAGLIERNRTYLTRFMELSRKSDDADALFDAMDELYPAYQLPFLLRRAANIAKGKTKQ